MGRKRLDSNRKGVGGFFVDLPIVVLVLAVTAVLTTSFYQLYLPRQEEKEESELSERCVQLKDEIQSFREILTDENGEKFSIEKLEKINETEVESYLGSRAGCEYSIYFEDLEGKFNRSFGSDPPDRNDSTIKTYTAPVSLVDRDGISSLGRLEVKVWVN
ncbi:MAG: hypothetical protein ACLFSM_06195 [Thermoplasmata archaeon]